MAELSGEIRPLYKDVLLMLSTESFTSRQKIKLMSNLLPNSYYTSGFSFLRERVESFRETSYPKAVSPPDNV